jgi:hypothetical protein
MNFAPIRDLAPTERRHFTDAVHAASAFDQLPSTFQAMITSAEAARDALGKVQQSAAQPAGRRGSVRTTS